MNLNIQSIERIWLDVRYREVPRRNMIRELPHWTIMELCRVTLENDVVGVGAEGDLGVGLHIKSADSGASVDSAGDELVIEGSGAVGGLLQR